MISKKKVVCYGEVLWDLLPGGRKPGGAPMNVAFHLRKLGAEPALISAVGADADGRDLVAYLEENGLPATYVERHRELPTGTVDVLLDDGGKATYRINGPVAWDAIPYRPELGNLVREADAFVFGTLAGREHTSRITLQQLLGSARLRVFDMNLRPPHVDPAALDYLLHRTDVLKINDDELLFLRKKLGLTGPDQGAVAAISRKFAIGTIVVTLGDKGAAVRTGDEWITHPGYETAVKDTVGSGDAFLAAFVSGLLSGRSWIQILDRSNAAGALVAGRAGANPDYTENDIENLISGNF